MGSINRSSLLHSTVDQCTSPFDSLQIWRRTEEREKWRLAMWAWLLPLFPPCDVRSHHTHKFRILILFFVCFFLILSLFFHRCLPQSLSHFAQTECVRSYFKIHTHRLSAGFKGGSGVCVCLDSFPSLPRRTPLASAGQRNVECKEIIDRFPFASSQQRRRRRWRYLTDRSHCAGHSCVIAKLFSLPTAHDGRLMDFSEYLFLFFFFCVFRHIGGEKLSLARPPTRQ